MPIQNGVLYISSDLQCSSSNRLKASVDSADTTFEGKLFQSSTTRTDKVFWRAIFVAFVFASLCWWLFRFVRLGANVNTSSFFKLTFPVMILYVMIMSPLLRRCCSEGSFSFRNLSSYVKELSPGTPLVALRWTLSTSSVSPLWSFPHMMLQYSRWGLTRDLKKRGNISLSRTVKDFLMTPSDELISFYVFTGLSIGYLAEEWKVSHQQLIYLGQQQYLRHNSIWVSVGISGCERVQIDPVPAGRILEGSQLVDVQAGAPAILQQFFFILKIL